MKSYPFSHAAKKRVPEPLGGTSAALPGAGLLGLAVSAM